MAKVTIIIEDEENDDPDRNIGVGIEFDPPADTNSKMTNAQDVGFAIIQFLRDQSVEIEEVIEERDNGSRH